MPVAFKLRFAGATTDQYDQVVEKMGFTPGGGGSRRGLLPLVRRDG